MAQEIILTSPNTGQKVVASIPSSPSLVQSDNGKVDRPAVEEWHAQLSGTFEGKSVTSKQNIQPYYENAVCGGEYVPNTALEGKQTRLSADITAVATSMTVDESTTEFNGVTENIFVADRPYLLMNREPVAGESPFDSGQDEHGGLKPNAEVIFIGSAYVSGTTVPIVRSDPNAAVRTKHAIIQAIPGVTASYGTVGNKGLRVEFERPDVVGMTSSDGTSHTIDGGSQEIDVRFIQSPQQADTPRASGTYAGQYGVVSHYGMVVLPRTGVFLNRVKALPSSCPPVSIVALASLTDYVGVSQVLTVGDITGTFQVGEPVTQDTSLAAGTIAKVVLGAASSTITIVVDEGSASRFDATNAITGTTSSATTTPTAVSTVLQEYKEVEGVTEYWDPTDNAVKTITAGDYWVAVLAMNQNTYTPSLRTSEPAFVAVTVE